MNSISRDPAPAASKQPGDCADVDSSAKSACVDAQQQATRSEKQALRTRLLPLRHAALARGPAITAAIAAGVRAWLDAQDCRCVAFYWPLTGEPDLRPTIIAWLAQDSRRRAALPLVVRAAAPLRFVAWTADTPMRVGKYGIAVPDVADRSARRTDDVTSDAGDADAGQGQGENAGPAEATRSDASDPAPATLSGDDVIPDALLIPCVGFDARGYRLGYGGGFYDRTLAALRETAAYAGGVTAVSADAPNAGSAPAQRLATLGIALDDTGVAALPTDAFDLPLDGIQTERRLYVAK